MNRFSQYIIALALLLNAFATNAQVVINEFCIANYSNWALTGEYEDWVEFYNPTGAAVNIGNYYLSDDPTDPTKWQIPAGYNIPANGYRVILLSGTGDYDPSYLGQNNTNFKITQTNGESIVFADATGAILEEYTFGTGISPSQA
ncbi:MAG: lamin tail domain-containing protein, partial [Flavobacteriales bacterium]